jgi:tripartite-type tricarboxylate transporter receptor subunit TctC
VETKTVNLKNLSRRTVLAAVAAAAAAPAALFAQDNRPIEWVVGYAAGGGSDVVARTVAEAMGKTLGQTIIINNKPGAATNIAAGYVASTRDAGHMLFTADFATLAANPWLFAKLPYNAEKDFIPVGMLARFPLLLVVNPAVPAKNYKEFVAWAKAQANPVSFASAGIGSPHHLAGELLRERSGLKLQHVAYKGAAPAVQDLLGGQVQLGFATPASVLPQVKAGRLRALAVASPQRSVLAPDVPTFAELGLSGVNVSVWYGLFGPAKMRAEQVEKVARTLAEGARVATVREQMIAQGFEPVLTGPQEFANFLKADREQWLGVAKAIGFKREG